jgi:PAS domain S-box-containing protein
MFTTTPSGRFISVNPALATMLGYASPEELTGGDGNAAMLYKESGVRERIVASFRENAGWVRHPGVVWRKKDGAEISVNITGHTVSSDESDPIHFEGFVEDQTGRMMAEAAYRAREESYRYLFLNAPSAIYEIDFHGPKFKSVNEAMCRISGYSREELLATNPLAFLDPDSRRSFQERIQRGLSGLPIDDKVEYRGIRKDGSEIWFVINIAFTFEAGKVIGALVMAHDITERKQNEKAIRKANRQLSLLMRSQGTI